MVCTLHYSSPSSPSNTMPIRCQFLVFRRSVLAAEDYNPSPFIPGLGHDEIVAGYEHAVEDDLGAWHFRIGAWTTSV